MLLSSIALFYLEMARTLKFPFLWLFSVLHSDKPESCVVNFRVSENGRRGSVFFSLISLDLLLRSTILLLFDVL